MFGLWFGRIGNRLIDVEYLDSCCCPWRSWSVKIPFDVMRSMSWACHERSCFWLAFSHGFCMSSLRWTWKNIEKIPGFPRSPEPSRTTNKHKNTRKTGLYHQEWRYPTFSPPEGGCTWKSDLGWVRVELIYRGTWYRNSSTLITPSTRNYGYDLGVSPPVK